jgi:hypothetical protein
VNLKWEEDACWRHLNEIPATMMAKIPTKTQKHNVSDAKSIKGAKLF